MTEQSFYRNAHIRLKLSLSDYKNASYTAVKSLGICKPGVLEAHLKLTALWHKNGVMQRTYVLYYK